MHVSTITGKNPRERYAAGLASGNHASNGRTVPIGSGHCLGESIGSVRTVPLGKHGPAEISSSEDGDPRSLKLGADSDKLGEDRIESKVKALML